MDNKFLEALENRVLVFDGATGTNLQTQNLKPEDFGDKKYEGCNEYLCISKPDAVRKVHFDYLTAGADVIETDSFGATKIVLKEFDLENRAYELSKLSAQIAKEMTDKFSTPEWPRFVAGSIGPGTKIASLGQVTFDEYTAAFEEQIEGLYDGGADVLCIETCQDLLQIKSALYAAEKVFDKKGKDLPVIVSVTVESVGTMLVGTDISSALTTLEAYDFVTAIGMNCAVGPKEMSENIRYLSQYSSKKIFIMPNAGLPENVGGKACYHLTPEEMGKWAEHYIKDLGVNILGGCCGTNSEHIKAIRKAADNNKPAKRNYSKQAGVTSLYTAVGFDIENPPLFIGERCNANGSKKFREFLLVNDYDAMVEMAKEQAAEGAHILDVCVAYVGRDEKKDMTEFVSRLRTSVQLPLMFDTTELDVMEIALKLYGGRAIVNSVNLEAGEDRANKVFSLVKKFGAAVVCLTIDEEGMAKTAEKKVAIAKRISDIAVNKFGLQNSDLIFDPLTFTLGSGDEEFRKSAMETLKAIKMIKEEIPDSRTVLGLSNVSFGLNPATRYALNSVFLYHAVKAGLDMAIVHASKIVPLIKLDPKAKELCEELILDKRRFEEE